MPACCSGGMARETESGRKSSCRALRPPTTSSACKTTRPNQRRWRGPGRTPRLARLGDTAGLAERGDEVVGEEERVEARDELKRVVVIGQRLHLAHPQIGDVLGAR